VLADAQTSGGLLVATDDPDALTSADVDAWVIGATTGGSPGTIKVTGRLAGS
jgi:hypothetical protein